MIAVGQDGLVANVAKYLDGQPVLGVNPDVDRNPGVLVRNTPDRVKDVLTEIASGLAPIEPRAMVEVSTDDGQRLRALNEIFIGHPAHQSARYTIELFGQDRGQVDGTTIERQSSSGC